MKIRIPKFVHIVLMLCVAMVLPFCISTNATAKSMHKAKHLNLKYTRTVRKQSKRILNPHASMRKAKHLKRKYVKAANKQGKRFVKGLTGGEKKYLPDPVFSKDGATCHSSANGKGMTFYKNGKRIYPTGARRRQLASICDQKKLALMKKVTN